MYETETLGKYQILFLSVTLQSYNLENLMYKINVAKLF